MPQLLPAPPCPKPCAHFIPFEHWISNIKCWTWLSSFILVSKNINSQELVRSLPSPFIYLKVSRIKGHKNVFAFQVVICKRQLPLLIAVRSQGRVCIQGTVEQIHKDICETKCKSPSNKAISFLQEVCDRNDVIFLEYIFCPL